MPKKSIPKPILPVEESYGPPVRLCLDTRFERELGDKVEVYGNEPVIERNGHIVAVMGRSGFEKPAMICEIPKE